jgi:hypothetical protein
LPQEVEARYRSLVEAVGEGTLVEVTTLLDPPSPGLLRRAAPQHGLTVLMLAASKGHVDMVQLLLRSGALVNQQDARGRTALMEACAAGKTEVATLLLEEGADAYMSDKAGVDAFQLACRLGHSTTFDRLWQKYTASTDVYVKEEELLVCADEPGRVEMVQMCMDEGMNPAYRLHEGPQVDRSTAARVECHRVIEVSTEEGGRHEAA